MLKLHMRREQPQLENSRKWVNVTVKSGYHNFGNGGSFLYLIIGVRKSFSFVLIIVDCCSMNAMLGEETCDMFPSIM